jgi:hypothetical protein
MFIDEFKKYVPDYVLNVSLVRLVHPREYNDFKNDEIEARIELSDDFRIKMKDFMSANEKWLRTKIKEDWSDKPGFWSFMSNDFDRWIKYLEQTEITGVNSNYYAEIIKYDMLNEDNDIANRIDQEVIENINLNNFIACIKR